MTSIASESGEAQHGGAPDTETAPTLAAGEIVGGKYVIKRVLGAGGNGAVYEGEHTDVGHRVAIKVVHPQLAVREETLARFRREARICGSLRHPHVGQVYDVGMLEDGSPYMVMELQEGRSLAEVLDDTKLPLPAVIEIVSQLLDGLGAAHRSGAVHRDVKPDNVMIVRDHSGAVIAKLVDFGISKSIGLGKAGEKSRVTGEGVIIGSPDYMPPEQLRGDDVDVRADIYSTGVLLFEAITRQLPFHSEHLVDLMTQIMRDEPAAPSSLRSDCPPELDAVVKKALAKDPEERYANTDEMARALSAVRHVLRALPPPNLAELDKPSLRPRAMTASRKRRTIDAHTFEGLRPEIAAVVDARVSGSRNMLAVAVAIAILALAAVAWWSTRSGEDSESRERVIASTLPQAASPMAPAPSTATPSATPPGQPAAASVALPAAAPVASAAQTPSTTTRHAVASVQSLSEERDKPVAQATKAREEKPREGKQKPARSEPVEDVQALIKEAASSFVLGDTAKAIALYQRAVKAAPREATAWRGLGVAAKRQGARGEAVRAFTRYLELRPDAADAERVRAQLAELQ